MKSVAKLFNQSLILFVFANEGQEIPGKVAKVTQITMHTCSTNHVISFQWGDIQPVGRTWGSHNHIYIVKFLGD